MAKKIFNLPESDPKTKKINYKNIAIGSGAVAVVLVISFSSIGGKKEENTKNKKTVLNKSERIDESENISTTEEIEKIVNTNPVLKTQANNNDLELEKLRLQKEYELKMLQEQYRQERLAWSKKEKELL